MIQGRLLEVHWDYVGDWGPKFYIAYFYIPPHTDTWGYRITADINYYIEKFEAESFWLDWESPFEDDKDKIISRRAKAWRIEVEFIQLEEHHG